MPCTTHHYACDCREKKLSATRDAARKVLDVFEILLPAMRVPGHLSPARLMDELRALVGFDACPVCQEPVCAPLQKPEAQPLGKCWAHGPCVARAERLYDEAAK